MTGRAARSALLAVAALASVSPLVVAGGGCRDAAPEAWDWQLPAGFPAPPVPADNPMSAAKVELGRHLFYDTRLSVDGDMSCATCHLQRLAFTDGRAQAIGTTGEVHRRSAMSLTNVAYSPRLSWASPLLDRLEDQALLPLFGEEPVEMGLAGREAALLEMLGGDALYSRLFRESFGGDADPVSVANMTRAIAAFERTLISGNAPYDRHLRGEADALTPAARRGLRLFLSERLECFHCHGGFSFTDSLDHEGMPTAQVAFHNTGLYDADGSGAYPATDTGLHELTNAPGDMGRFKAPTLRNIAVTAPYMHDGSLATLAEVIEHYADGGRHPSKLTSEFVSGFVLEDEELSDLLAFLDSLTDPAFLSDPRFAAPPPR